MTQAEASEYIAKSAWPPHVKDMGQMILVSRKERQLPDMTAEQWDAWALKMGGAGSAA